MTTRRATANDDSILKSMKHVFNVTGRYPNEVKYTQSHKKGKSDELIESLKNEKFYTEAIKRQYPNIGADTISKKVLGILNGSNQFNRSFDTFGKNLSRQITEKISNYNKSHNFNYNDYGSVAKNLNRHAVNIINNVFSEMNVDDRNLRNYKQKLIYDILHRSDNTTITEDIENIKDKFQALLKDIITKRENSTLGQYIEYLINNINKKYVLEYPDIDDVETTIKQLIENSRFDRENPDIKKLNENIHTMIEEIRNNPTTDIKGNDMALTTLTKYIEKSDEMNNFVNELNQRLDKNDLIKYYDNSSDKLKIANNPIDVKDFTDRIIKIINEISQDDDIGDLKQSLINSVNEIYQNNINNDISTVKKSVINIVNRFNSDNNNIKDFQTKIIERINSDDFIVKNNPVENYKQEVVYSLINPYEKDSNIKHINDTLTNIERIVDSEEYDDNSIESLNTEISRLNDYSDSINQDENTKKRFNEVNQKITECIEAATNNDNLNQNSKKYLEYITENLKDIVSKTTESGDLEYIPSIDIDELTEKIANETIEYVNAGNKKEILKNIGRYAGSKLFEIFKDNDETIDNEIVDTIASKIADKNNVGKKSVKEYGNIIDNITRLHNRGYYNRIGEFENSAFDISNRLTPMKTLKPQSDSELRNAMSKAIDPDFINEILKGHEHNDIESLNEIHNISSRFGSNVLNPMNTTIDDELRNIISKAIDSDFLNEIILGDESEEELPEDESKLIKNAINNELNQLFENDRNETNDLTKDEEQPYQNESPRQLSTEVSDNDINKYEEDEHQNDKNTSNEMSENSGEGLTTTILSTNKPLSEIIAEGQPSETETPQISLQDVVDARKQILSDDSNPQEPEASTPSVIQADSTNVQLMPQNSNDIGRINVLIDTLNKYIQMLQYSQSSTDTNNLLGGIVSIFKELPNIGDDEIANKLSEAVGPDGKKLFESKEEAARFIAKMRALNGNRLSSIKGGGSGQKTGIQLNITNKVVSNMPRKPFIVDTHPIPYQY